jgi:hypothetical protein
MDGNLKLAYRPPVTQNRKVWLRQILVRMRRTDSAKTAGAFRERGYKPPFDDLPWKDETENNA